MGPPGFTWDDVRQALAAAPARSLEDAADHRAAVAVILREGPRGLEVLFIRRAEHPHDPWSGQMAFPGGRAEPGDGDLRYTAMRETQEETGLDLAQDGELLGRLDELRATARGRPLNLAITPYVFRLARPAEPTLSDEVTSVHWLGLDDLLGPAHRSQLEYVYQGQTLQLPCLRVDDLVIWGLTYRMFSSLGELLASPDRAEVKTS
jgi:8-oxo-dGTP pyrophosphatase MutT (NUDIX family)